MKPALAAEEKLVSVQTKRGVEQQFILIKPDNPIASVILFAGGHGALGLTGPEDFEWGEGNFLVRTRRDFAAKGLVVAVIDAPSDRTKMNAKFRMGRKHAGDMAAVAKYLKRLKDIPVWVVGTSMGTFSAANVAIRKRKWISGLVLTSTITRARENWSIKERYPDGVASMKLRKVRAPTLIVSHEDDGCEITPASDATKLEDELVNSSVVKIVLVKGGRAAESDACKAKSQHGFYGVESEAVDAISKFIKAN
jgi:alpha-beta hydrolase superfamily lysophospholipase